MQVEAFLAKWGTSGGGERANKDQFLIDLCHLLGVPTPTPTTGDPRQDTYCFERRAEFVNPNGTSSYGYIDLYKEGCFVLEAKQGSSAGAARLGTARRESSRWALEMQNAYGQAASYARTLTNPPPFLVVADLGFCFDLHATFDGSHAYRPFPAGTTARFFVADIAKHIDLLRAIFLDPHSLDPSKHAAKVTREVAEKLAVLAKALEAVGHGGEDVARFLMRCLFTMFAEDVDLLPDKVFSTSLVNHWRKKPDSFPGGIEALWRAMNDGSHFGALGKLLQFNGGLFRDAKALPLSDKALDLLVEAASFDWSAVEPAIFGTLLERALDPRERHKLGAHYTPRAYVERLVKPTIEEPLRAEWAAAQTEVRLLLQDAERAKTQKAADLKRKKAVAVVQDFHKRLCSLKVLDPACGTGNFLYVSLDVFKRLESEVIAQREALGDIQQGLEVGGFRVTPDQFLGIEVKPWAKEIAELVLWIGYLQWHFRIYGKANVPEPVLRDYRNIECRDAVLATDTRRLLVDPTTGEPVRRWDGFSTKKHPVTGEDIPDESKTAAVEVLPNPRKAAWPAADFIVGNPPFLGTKRMRALLGDGYVNALRATYSGDLQENADFVMFWWSRASAALTEKGARLKRFGLITTNSISQSFNRRVIDTALTKGCRIVWAIPDHPWTDCDTGAAVRIAMTVCSRDAAVTPRVARVVREMASIGPDGAPSVELGELPGEIHADLRQGVAVSAAVRLVSNQGVSGMGVALHGAGFILTPGEAAVLRTAGSSVIRRYVGGRDLQQVSRERYLIDFSGMTEDEARHANAAAFQRIVDRVLPERMHNRRPTIRDLWWRFGWERPLVRAALRGLQRYIATTETAKHRTFTFVDGATLADHKVIVFALEDPYSLGILSSRAHVVWAVAAGGRLGVGNDSVYNKTRCFDPFPFPVPTDALSARIGTVAEQLDAHRKARQSANPKLSITDMYNVLTKLRAAEVLTEKEKLIHEQGLISVLRRLHDELDTAVFEAYGWPSDLTDEQILERVFALNAERAQEERSGRVRWLRPDLQAIATDDESSGDEEAEEAPAAASEPAPETRVRRLLQPWPAKVADRMAAVRDALNLTPGASAAELAAGFKGAGEGDIADLLDGMAALGVLVGLPGPERRFVVARAS